MHHYSINNNNRKTAIVILSIISLILNSILYELIEKFISFLKIHCAFFDYFLNFLDQIGLTVNFFTFTAILGFLYWIFSKKLWKICLLKKHHHIPDLNGTWNGKLISSYKKDDGTSTILNISASIKQDWDKISIHFTFPDSSSYSNYAALDVDANSGVELVFTYVNNSKNVDLKTRKHEGCNILNYDEQSNTLTGRYFTNREKGTYGNIELKKSS